MVPNGVPAQEDAAAQRADLCLEDAETPQQLPFGIVQHRPCSPPMLPTTFSLGAYDAAAPLGAPPPMDLQEAVTDFQEELVACTSSNEKVFVEEREAQMHSQGACLSSSLTTELRMLLEMHQARLVQHLDSWMKRQERLVERLLKSAARPMQKKPVAKAPIFSGSPLIKKQCTMPALLVGTAPSPASARESCTSLAGVPGSQSFTKCVPTPQNAVIAKVTPASSNRPMKKGKTLQWQEANECVEIASESRESKLSKASDRSIAKRGTVMSLFSSISSVFRTNADTDEDDLDEESEDIFNSRRSSAAGLADQVGRVTKYLHAQICQSKLERIENELKNRESEESEDRAQARKSLQSQHRQKMIAKARASSESHFSLDSLTGRESSNSMPAADRTSAASAHSLSQVLPSSMPEMPESLAQSDRKSQRFTSHMTEETKSTHTWGSFHDLHPAKNCRERLQRLVAHSAFELVFGIAIISNSMYIGVEVDYRSANPEKTTPAEFYVIGYTYTVIFTIELMIRIVADGKNFCAGDPKLLNGRQAAVLWNILDVLIVSSSLLEMGLDVYQFATAEQEGGLNNMSNMRLIRIIRVTRLMRLFRIGRIVKFVRALRTLVYSIVHTMKSVVWSMLLLTMIIYVFAILFTQAATDYFMEIDLGLTEPTLDEVQTRKLSYHFGTLADAMLTLFMSISGGISWIEVCRPLREVSLLWLFVFLTFITFTYFAVLNVVTGLFCQSAIESQQADQETMIQAFLSNQKSFSKRFKQIFKTIDTDGSGYITLEEFMEHIEEPKVAAYFATLDLEPRDAVNLFKLLDEGRDHHGIDIEDFVMGCLRLKGPAKSYDMARLMAENKQIQRLIREFAAWIQDNFSHNWTDVVSAPIDLVEEEDYLASRVTATSCSSKEPFHQCASSMEPLAFSRNLDR